MIALETAQAAKFEATIREALGLVPPVPQGFEALFSLPQKADFLDNDLVALKAKVEAFDA